MPALAASSIGNLFDEMILRPDSPIFGTMMVRKPCVLTVGPYDPRLPTPADVDMWLRLLLRFDAPYIAKPLLRIAPREAGHYNSATNWRVREEHKLIYALNSARRQVGHARELTALRGQISPTLWKLRLICLLSCLRHRRTRAAVEGLRFMTSGRVFSAEALPDSVVSWDEVVSHVKGAD